MTPFVVALILGAALLHATWNALLRSGGDRLWSITLMSMTSAAVSLPFAVTMAPPSHASWPYIALSAVLQIGYCLFLVRAYREGELAQVYPIARGASPLLVTLGAAVVAGERLSAADLAGIALVSGGIFALAFGKTRPSLHSTLAALATGVFIAAYTLTDGVGARTSGNAPAYAAWLFVTQGAPMPLVYMALRGRLAIKPRDPETLKAVGGGMISMVAYGIVVWALTMGPMGQVSALRETSVLFAALIGVLFLKERMTLARLGAAAMIAAGAFLLSAGAV
jgi:drug/metabolite transporter (DMT)-like permease